MFIKKTFILIFTVERLHIIYSLLGMIDGLSEIQSNVQTSTSRPILIQIFLIQAIIRVDCSLTLNRMRGGGGFAPLVFFLLLINRNLKDFLLMIFFLMYRVDYRARQFFCCIFSIFPLHPNCKSYRSNYFFNELV